MARGDIVVRLIGDTRDLERKFASVGSRLEKTGRKLQSVGRSLTVGLTLPILAIGGSAIKSAIDFETAFSGIRKTVNGTEAQFARLAAGIRKMAKDTGTSAGELAAIGEAAGALGIATEDILAFIEVVNQLDVATELSAADAATALGKLKNVLDLSVGDLDNVSAAIVSLGNSGSSTEPEIVDLALRIAGAGKNAGLTAAEIFGLSAAIADAGINAERGGTSIQKTLQDMAVAVSKGGKELETFGRVAGTTGAGFAESFGERPAEATANFIAGLQRIRKESGPGGVLGVLRDLGITESRQIDTLQLLSQAQSSVADKMRDSTKAYRDGTAAQEEFDKKQQTTERRIAKLREQFRDIGITLGEALIPILEQATPVIESMAKAFAKGVEIFKSLPGPVQTGIVIFAALLAVIGPILVVIGTLTTAIAAISAPVAIVVAAIVALIAVGVLLWRHWDKIKGFLKTIWNALKTAALAVFNFLKKLFLNFTPVGRIIQHWDKIKGFLAGAWRGIKGAASKVFKFLKDLFLNFTPVGRIIKHWDKIVNFFKKLPGKIKRAAAGMWDGIRDAFKAAINWIIDRWNGLEFRIPSFKFGPVKFGGFTLGLPDIPRLAQGGIVTKPTLALVGEAGPEAVIPLRRGASAVRQGNVYHITVKVPPTVNKAAVGAEIVTAIKAYEKGSGKRWRQ